MGVPAGLRRKACPTLEGMVSIEVHVGAMVLQVKDILWDMWGGGGSSRGQGTDTSSGSGG